MGAPSFAAAAVLALCLALSAPASAIMSGAESNRAPSSDPDYAQGKAAFLNEDWRAAIEALDRVILRRPRHDNAHSMLGFANRKLGRYDRAFAHYAEALRLNPRHRGALEYLGEAYLELGRMGEARGTARRLAQVCAEVVMGFDNSGWKYGCEELDDLRAAFAAAGVAIEGPAE